MVVGHATAACRSVCSLAMVKAITVRIEIEVHIGADEVDAEDLERWIFDPDELRPWPADASIRCAPTVHGLCTDAARQA